MSETYETLAQFSDRYWRKVRRSPEFIHRAAGHRLYQIENCVTSSSPCHGLATEGIALTGFNSRRGCAQGDSMGAEPRRAEQEITVRSQTSRKDATATENLQPCGKLGYSSGMYGKTASAEMPTAPTLSEMVDLCMAAQYRMDRRKYGIR